MATPVKFVKLPESTWRGLRVESRRRDISIAKFVDYMLFGGEGAGLPTLKKKK